MIYLTLPVGSTHGWGVCGKYITRELARLTSGNVRLITDPLTLEMVGDDLEFAELAALLAKPDDLQRFPVVAGERRLDGPLLAAIVDKQMLANWPGYRGTRTVGYTFFEENLMTPAWIENARRNFDAVATGSSWCTDVLRRNGLAGVETVIQGVDHRIFFPAPVQTHRQFLRDRFVVFSGGKFELRKGQDIVIRAFKALQDRHDDVLLVNAWFNPWPGGAQSMQMSPHIRIAPQSGPYAAVINRILADNGIDLRRVITLLPRPNALTARIYHNTDVGIFPNRCEGGTNLVLMEYMACGKPAVATASTGHADVVNADHALVIGSREERTYNGPAGPAARWPEPDLDQAVAQLEFAYQNRDHLRDLGDRAGRAMAALTWERAAEAFLKILNAT